MKAGSRIRLFFLIPGNFLALVLACLGIQILRSNLLGWFLFLFGVAYMAGGAIFLWPENAPLVTKSNRAVRDEAGDRSFWLVIPGFVAVFFASPVEYLYLGGITRAGPSAQIAGLVLILLGFALRFWTRLTIKGQYTGHVQTVAGGTLQTGGPYHYIRHPGYAGFLLMSLGLGIGFGSYLGVAATLLFLLPGLFYRMRVEEELLLEQFGDEYRQFAARTKRLIPGIW
jgi:protein-S-isoprenylcysteine O-methyltransferase Ste14